jgi:hypothetical protein
MSGRGSTGVKPEDEITEIVKAEIERVDGVLGPANGTAPLLMKSLPGEPHVDVDVVLKAAHGPFTGRHSHPHPALGAQGDDETHEHEHSHDGDADHGHAHEVAKAEMSAKEINDLPDSAFAHIEAGGEKDSEGRTTPRSLRHYPVHDKAHADNAAARASAELDGDGKAAEIARAAMPKIKAAQKKFGSGEAKKALDGAEEVPGSPAWEAQDAANLRTVAAQLAALKDRLENAADRERAEAESGADPDDLESAWDLDDACCALNAALGIVARLAFTEQQEAVSPDADGVAKAGRRLSAKSMEAISAARDRLTELLGEDAGPEPSAVDTPLPAAAGGTDVTADDLSKALDERLTPIRESLDRIAKELPQPSGGSLADGSGRADAESARQDRGGLPGLESPPEETVETPGPGTELPGMEEAKRAETAPDANPQLAKSTENPTAEGQPAPAAPPALDAEALAKALAEGPFAKALESTVARSVEGAVKPLQDGMTALEKRVEEIAGQPMPGGPLLNGAANRQDHYMVLRPPMPIAQPAIPGGDDAAVTKALESLSPQDRDVVSRALAVQASPFAQRQQ